MSGIVRERGTLEIALEGIVDERSIDRRAAAGLETRTQPKGRKSARFSRWLAFIASLMRRA